MKYLFSCLLFLILACNNGAKVSKVNRAFYHWNNHLYLENELKNSLENVDVKKLYVKYFEVDYNDVLGDFPYDKLEMYDYSIGENKDLEIIPVVYIKNEIFKYNNDKSLDELADNIVFLINKYNKEKFGHNSNQPFKEIQIDCDWTKTTRDKYFYLLNKIKVISKKSISCTLRLYPYKYPEYMGVPPVNKATLMCYNLENPLISKKQNSILSLKELKKYLDNDIKYPLHLDVALPMFYWSILYKNNQFSEVLRLTSKDLLTFSKKVKPMWYEVNRDTVIYFDKEIYLRKGDQLKCEEISHELLLETIQILKKNVKLDEEITVSFFNINDNTFKLYPHEKVIGYYNHFIGK